MGPCLCIQMSSPQSLSLQTHTTSYQQARSARLTLARFSLAHCHHSFACNTPVLLLGMLLAVLICQICFHDVFFLIACSFVSLLRRSILFAFISQFTMHVCLFLVCLLTHTASQDGTVQYWDGDKRQHIMTLTVCVLTECLFADKVDISQCMHAFTHMQIRIDLWRNAWRVTVDLMSHDVM